METSRNTLPTVTLTIHPALKDLPEWADDDPQFEALCRDIHRRGIDYPLKVTASNKVVDGRHRLRGAKRVKLESVPVEIVPDDQITALILHSLIQRRHYTKGALAYMLLPVVDSKRSQETLATEGGFSRQLLQQALEVRSLFSENGKEGEEYKAEVEPKILSGEVGLGAVIAGWAGRQATKGQSKKQTSALELWGRSIADFQKRFSTWQKFDVAAKNTVLARFQSLVENAPTELVYKLTSKFSAELKRRKKGEGK